MQVCYKCLVEKNDEDFQFRKDTGKLRRECRKCHYTSRRAWAEENKEYIANYQASYSSSHLEEKSAYNKQYRADHSEELAVAHAAWRAANKERIATNYKAFWEAYYPANKPSIAEKKRAYYRTPKGKYASLKATSKGRKIDFLLSFDEFMTFWQKPCSYCGNFIELAAIDRIDSSKPYELNNCVSCCSRCNYMKLQMSVDEWCDSMLKVLVHLGKLSRPPEN